jgi:hypothetical protein
MRLNTPALTIAAIVAVAGTAAANIGENVTTKIAYLSDPMLNMKAVAVKVPSRWQFKGRFWKGDTCVTVPEAIYKATSPDGATSVSEEPNMVWKFGKGPAFDSIDKKDCLPLDGPMSAQRFLKHYVETLTWMKYVGPEPVPANVLADERNERAVAMAQVAKEQQRDIAADRAAGVLPPNFNFHPKQTFEDARAIVTSRKGSIAMRGRLDVRMNCIVSETPGGMQLAPDRPPRMIPGPGSTVTSCGAAVMYLTAPEANFVEVSRAFDGALMGHPKYQAAWAQAWMGAMQAQTIQGMEHVKEWTQRDMAMHAQEFARDQQTRQAMHDQFMTSFNQNFENSQAINNANINARTQSASDWVDYAGDLQTVQNTTTGATYKESNLLPPGDNEARAHGNGNPW